MKKRTFRTLTAGMMTAAMAASLLAGCAKEDTAKQTDTETVNEAVNETAEQGADQKETTTDQAILVVSFGTSYNDNRDLSIGATEEAIQEAFPDYEVRRAFTSQIIIDKLEERDGLEIDNVTEALDRAVEDGIKNLVVQPTHLMDGYEYQDLVGELAEYAEAFEKIEVGAPLLTSDEDFENVVKAITADTKEYDDGETAICFMGHGTEAESNEVYAKMQELLTEEGYDNYFVGTVEASPTLEDVMALVDAGNYKNVVLEPLMVVAGDHANNDMAGDEEGSWKKAFEDAGYNVECLIQGLGQLEEIQDIYVEHTQDAINKMADPITADMLKDGEYTIDVESNASMFKVVDCKLTVKEGKMTAVITMSGTGYTKMYMGSAEEAASASEEDCIAYVETAESAHTFELPVEALNQEITCSSYSKKKAIWYDRTLVFQSAALPVDAYQEIEMTTVESMGLEDGEYQIEVSVEGGTGKVKVESPVTLIVKDGKATAAIRWTSPYYDYMLVNDQKYTPTETTDEISAYEIPVEGFDWKMPVTADTIAMSTPHEIDYTLYFDSATLK